MTDCKTKACTWAGSLILGLAGGAVAAWGLMTLVPPPPPVESAPVVVSEDGSTPLAGLAVLDMQQVLATSKAGQNLQDQVAAAREDMRGDVDAQEARLRDIEGKLATARDTGDAQTFAIERKKFEAEMMEARRDLMATKRALDEATAQASGQLRDAVIEIAAQMGAERGYRLVLTRGNVVIVDPSLDITADVIAALDAQMPGLTLDLKAAK
jgi:Skp family chaperone for outer membrane proteins